MPYDPDEMEEIRKLLENSLTNNPTSSERQKRDKPGEGAAAPQNPAAGQSGVPALRQQSPDPRQPAPMARIHTADERRARPFDIFPEDSGQEGPRPGDSELEDFEPKKSGQKNAETELDTGSAKFKVNFDFESAYKDVPENRPLRFRREKRTGCAGGILYAAFVICFSLVLASLVWMAAVDVLGFGQEDEKVNVTVQQGFKIEDITNMLYDAGLIRYKFLFNIYAGYSKAEAKITAGSYVLHKNLDYRALVQGMTARAGARVETTVTIPEGYTLSQIFDLLVDYGVCSTTTELWAAARYYNFDFGFLKDSPVGQRLRLEGFMFPETYNFYLNSTAIQAITRFLREFDKRFTEEYTERAAELGYTVKDIITIASMIEREAGSDEERPRIAAVIYNRLKNSDFPNLQIDATIHYAIAGTDNSFSLTFDSPYNTYTHVGLPPGPIANPGMFSIIAALYPDTTDEYYYALNKSGTHNFFKTREQQEAFVQSDEYGGR